MKDHLHQLVARSTSPLAASALVREYLQARVLQSLQDSGVFVRWAFVGGTALRFLFALPRFSEDLDFSTVTPGTDAGLIPAMEAVTRELQLEGYQVELAPKRQNTVESAFVKFPGLLHELQLSPRVAQVLSIKVEVDTNPPSGARIATTIVRRHATLNLCHYDRASLFAGKLHAVLSRPWTKGRDLFDLAWYLSDRSWPAPNLDLLNAALAQTGWQGPTVAADTWQAHVRSRLAQLDWPQAQADVRPFLEHERDIQLVTREALDQLLTGSLRE